MRHRTAACRVTVALILATLVSLISTSRTVVAVHDSTNMLVFEVVDGSGSPPATGEGVIEYRGGSELDSRWTVQLRFGGLAAGERYVAVVQGRYGAAGQPNGDEFNELCSFEATSTGDGGCWWYLVRMQQVNVVQLRLGAVDGPPVVQATRNGDGPGSITSFPNAYSPPEASPAASPLSTSPASSPSAS